MPITLRDCLKLPSFADATVIAGAGGLDRIVQTVSANEAPQAADITPGEARNQQLILSAFISVRDDVEKQCDLIRRFDEFHMAGLVIFHFGHYVSGFDQKLRDLADRLNFPIICLNPERGILYTDVTHDIYGILYSRDVGSEVFLSALSGIRQELEGEEAVLEYTLNRVSEKLGGALVLADDQCTLLCSSDLPSYFLLNREEPLYGAGNLLDKVRRLYETPVQIPSRSEGIEIEIGYGSIWLHCIPVRDTYRQMCYLLLFTQMQRIPQALLHQIEELVQQAINRDRNHVLGGKNTFALLTAVFQGPREYRDYLAKQLGVDLDQVGAIWFVRCSGRRSHRQNLSYYGQSQVNIATSCLRELLIPLLGGSYLGGVVLLLDKKDVTEDMRALAEAFAGGIEAYFEETDLYTYTLATGIEQAGSIINLIKRNYSASKHVFPMKRIFTQQDLLFVDYCRAATRNIDKEAWPVYHVLESLQYDNTLITLLEAMVLDTGMDAGESARLLFLHRNTVYYRLKKIRSLLGYDPFQMPAVSNIAMALAMHRLVLKS